MASRPALPKTLNQATARRILEEHGWRMEQGGKHVVKMVKAGARPITLPQHRGRDYGPSLRATILKAAGLLPNRDRVHSDPDGTPATTEGE
jgi:predicted RNA binding protein YcfA (HicA-like mRNA interferase family)